jgi:hypothetical protein
MLRLKRTSHNALAIGAFMLASLPAPAQNWVSSGTPGSPVIPFDAIVDGYTAAYLGHACITAEDILAGLLREDREIRAWLNPEALDEIRQAIGVADKPTRKFSVVGPLPMSETPKQILSFANLEAERAGTKKNHASSSRRRDR